MKNFVNKFNDIYYEAVFSLKDKVKKQGRIQKNLHTEAIDVKHLNIDFKSEIHFVTSEHLIDENGLMYDFYVIDPLDFFEMVDSI